MNIALLNDSEIDIEKLCFEYEVQGIDRKEIKNHLNDKYRRFSQKGDFRCVCCNERVKMVLSEEKVFFFRHFDKKSCSFSENHKTYKNQKESLEDKPKHRAGKAILRTYLEGICKLKNIIIKDGYGHRNTLSFVPDFILEFPNGQMWAIDYITGLKTDSKYAKSLAKRRDAYIKQQFTPIFLIDRYWMAYEHDINYVSIVEGELLCVKKSKQDYLWTEYISRMESHLIDVLFDNKPLNRSVKSIAYFAPHEREISIIRFLHEEEQQRKTKTLYKPITIPIDKALQFNSTYSDFIYSDEDEENYMEEWRKELEQEYNLRESMRKQQAAERKRKEERQKEEDRKKEEQRKREEDRKYRENLRIEEEERKKTEEKTMEYDGSIEDIPFIGRSERQMNSDLKREIASTTKDNNFKDSYQYKQMIRHMTKYFEQEDENRTESKEKKIISWRNERNSLIKRIPTWMLDELLNHYVNGEGYFINGRMKWKEIVLHSFDILYEGKLTTLQLLEMMKIEGIKFEQSDKVMLYPVNEYVRYIGRKLKREVTI
ncbi:cell envelope integrity protein TolA [Bacillus sp. B1-b2]|uniref:cell envelope integrity protein TolA n=1 Tax=Bacillus sp. B1-b2 TaxID=2653201 RepID=UPI0012619F08|nr:cell envelope integrity protein TolA [Bacillus sp. B1-b2]KAB7671677.1 hypothetical protein F9279_04980 [Bacillus sp. B1-b2]